MAAPCREVVRSVVKGLYQLSNRKLWMQSPLVPSVTILGSQQHALHSRPLHCSRGPALTISKTEPLKGTESQKATEPTKKTTVEEEEEDGPEYIPKRKAKNPMMTIGYAWMIGLPSGIIGFVLAKREVDKNRLKQLRIRQRMKAANEGEYDSSRYNTATKRSDEL